MLKKRHSKSIATCAQNTKKAKTAAVKSIEKDHGPGKKKDVEGKKPQIRYLCPICQDDLQIFPPNPDRQITSATCGHLFCRICIVQWLNQHDMCPKCETPQQMGDIHPVFFLP